MRQRLINHQVTRVQHVKRARATTTPRLGRFGPPRPETVAHRISLPIPARQPAKAADRLFADAVQSMIEAIQAKDAYTRGHSRRVGFYAELIARALGLPEEDVREISLGGQLHDVGKIGIPDGVLGKGAELAEHERCAVERHPLIGEQIAAPLLKRHPVILSIVRWHHERFDGRGFPDGLSGSLIPLGPRIVAVADAFDAMTSRRPYRAALPLTAAIQELVREAGRQFDPACVQAFVAAVSGLMGGTRQRRERVRTAKPAARSLGNVRWPSLRWPVLAAREIRWGGPSVRRAPARLRCVGGTGPFELRGRPRGPPTSEYHRSVCRPLSSRRGRFLVHSQIEQMRTVRSSHGFPRDSRPR